MLLFSRIKRRRSGLGLLFVSIFLISFCSHALASDIKVAAGEYLVYEKSTHRSTHSKTQNVELRTDTSSLHRSSVPTGTPVSLDKNAWDRFCGPILAAHPDAVCEPNYIVQVSTVPNDFSEELLPNIVAIQGSEGFMGKQGEGAVVAVIDTGVDHTHPDLAANIWINPGEIAGNGIDDDGNGYIDDIHGINALTNGDPMDDHGHGTHVAGTIAAVGNNGTGIIGVAPKAKIMALKFLGPGGGGTIFGALKLIKYAQDHGAKIINASWGGRGESYLLRDAVNDYVASGGIFVSAAGNSTTNNDEFSHFPSNWSLNSKRILSVAAVDNSYTLADFSNYGSNSVDIAAPGVGIMSTLPNGGYAQLNGTSMATPHVAALAALLLGEDPSLTADQVVDRILGNGKFMKPSFGNTATNKVINVGMALNNSGDAGSGEPHGMVAVNSFFMKGSKKVFLNKRVKAEFESTLPNQSFTAYLAISDEHSCQFELATGDNAKIAISLRYSPKGALRGSRSIGLSTDTDVGIKRSVKSGAKGKRYRKQLRAMSAFDPLVATSCARIQKSIRVLKSK